MLGTLGVAWVESTNLETNLNLCYSIRPVQSAHGIFNLASGTHTLGTRRRAIRPRGSFLVSLYQVTG